MYKRILIISAYLAAATVVVVGTIVLVAYARGYSYDFKTHRFVLNGLVILNSSPSGSTVTLNGKVLRRKTPYRTTIEAGTYDFSVSRAGFKTWTKRLVVRASEVTFAEYAILLPDQLKTEPVAVTPAIAKMANSRDHRQAAYITAADPAVWVFNLDSRQAVKLFAPKAAAADQPAETLSDVAWSDDGTHLLVRTTLGGKPNFYLIQDSPGSTPVDLTSLFKFDFAQLKFNPANWRELYWISPEGLRKLNVEQQTVSAVLADKVSSFAFGGDRVFYVQATPIGRSLWALDRAGRKQELVQSLAESDGYELAYDNFRGRDLLAVIPSSAATLTIYSDIFSQTPVSKVISKAAAHVLLSGEGRYFVFYNGERYGLYDAEKDEISMANAMPGPIGQLSLFDGYHVLARVGGDLYIGEFDGDNLSKVADAVSPASLPFATADQKRIISLRLGSDPPSGNQFFSTEIRH